MTLCPDPHVECWMLLDSAAFQDVFGKGCGKPDSKCKRGRYKNLLVDAISSSPGPARQELEGVLDGVGTGLQIGEDGSEIVPARFEQRLEIP